MAAAYPGEVAATASTKAQLLKPCCRIRSPPTEAASNNKCRPGLGTEVARAIAQCSPIRRLLQSRTNFVSNARLGCGLLLAPCGLNFWLASGRWRSARLRIRLGIRERQCTAKEGAGQSVHAVKPLEVVTIISKSRKGAAHVPDQSLGRLWRIAHRTARAYRRLLVGPASP